MYKKLESLFERKNINAHIASKETKIPYSCFMDWKHGKSTPKVDKLKILADYFGVSIDYFLS